MIQPARSLKITPTHLERKAIIYIRQSSPKQVRLNTESQRNQRALVERAQSLGWSPARIVVLDADLGQSATSKEGRDDFTQLAADVALGHVGIIFGWEVSRLARNNADWYQLLDLAAVVGALIADIEGVYDPRSYNDRLLLGLKGTMSEAELHMMRQRLSAGRLSKVARGEYMQHLPTGLVRTAEGRVEKDPDEQIRRCIALVFSTFAELGSGLKTLHFLKAHHILLPRHQTSGLRKGELLWKEPTESMIIEILHNPAYAGAFVYGRRPIDPVLRKPGRRGSGVVRKPMEEWVTLQQGVYPAYISWEQFLRNQARLAENTQEAHVKQAAVQGARGAAREGEALLQGLICCGMCGHRMRVAYKSHLRYLCDGLKRHYAGTVCMSLYGPAIEEVVITAFFDAIRPAQLDALSALLIQRAKEEERLVQHHHDQVRRATYEAHLARRRYEAVDPDNRLVAASLERGWEEKLLAQRQAEEEAERFQQRPIFPTLAPELRQQLEQIGPALPALWRSGKISNEHKKRLLRSLISRVIATKIAVDLIEIKIVWVSGHFSLAQVIPPIHRQSDASNYPELLARIDLLTKQGLTDPEITAQLTREGFHTARRGAVTVATIHKLRSRDDQVSASVLHQHRKVAMVNGYWTIPGLTRELGVGDNWLYSRIRQGRFSEADIQQLPNYRVYLIRNDPVLLERLRAEAVASRRYDTTGKQSHS
jgi:DNA invertase Pin-like site-specific DNA recombinase